MVLAEITLYPPRHLSVPLHKLEQAQTVNNYATVMTRLLLLFGFVLVSTTADAQLIYEINPDAGYRLGGGFNYTVDLTNSTVKFDFESKPSFGLNAAVGLTPGFFLEFEWDRQNTTLSRVGLIDDDSKPTLDVKIDYYHGAFVFQYAYDRMQPFGFFSLGATTFYPEGDLSSRTRFSLGGGAGFKYYLSRSVGFRAQARFYSTSMNSEAGQVWCDLYGCWSTTRINWLTQWSFTGGLIIRIGDRRRRRY